MVWCVEKKTRNKVSYVQHIAAAEAGGAPCAVAPYTRIESLPSPPPSGRCLVSKGRERSVALLLPSSFGAFCVFSLIFPLLLPNPLLFRPSRGDATPLFQQRRQRPSSKATPRAPRGVRGYMLCRCPAGAARYSKGCTWSPPPLSIYFFNTRES